MLLCWDNYEYWSKKFSNRIHNRNSYKKGIVNWTTFGISDKFGKYYFGEKLKIKLSPKHTNEKKPLLDEAICENLKKKKTIKHKTSPNNKMVTLAY